MSLKQKTFDFKLFDKNDNPFIAIEMAKVNKKPLPLRFDNNIHLSCYSEVKGSQVNMSVISILHSEIMDGQLSGQIGHLSWKLNLPFIELQSGVAKWRYHCDDLQRIVGNCNST